MTKIGEDALSTVPLSQSDLPLDTIELARFLLGKRLVRIVSDVASDAIEVVVRVTETEAYPPGDEAGHAWRGVTARNSSLFRSRGHAYVYLAYGVSWMLNVSSETEGVGAGVLIRAAEPERGLPEMLKRRSAVPSRDLARGPGRLAMALGVDRTLDGHDLCAPGPLFLASGESAPLDIGVSPRIGITRAVDAPLRFFLKGSRFVSGPASLNGVPGRRSHVAPPHAMVGDDEGSL